MRAISLFIYIFLMVFNSCKSEYTRVVDVYKNGKPKDIRIYESKSNLRNYKIIKYYENGNVKFKGTVSDKMFIGQKFNWYENGKLRQIDSLISPCELLNCSCDGKVIRYDSLGNLLEDFENRNGVENGIVNVYSKKGKLLSKYEMKDGRKNGFIINYHENGVPAEIGSFKDDKFNDFIYLFNESGDTIQYNNNKNGEMTLPYKRWLDNDVILYGNYYEENKKLEIWKWIDKSGHEIKKVIKKANKSKLIVPEL